MDLRLDIERRKKYPILDRDYNKDRGEEWGNSPHSSTDRSEEKLSKSSERSKYVQLPCIVSHYLQTCFILGFIYPAWSRVYHQGFCMCHFSCRKSQKKRSRSSSSSSSSSFKSQKEDLPHGKSDPTDKDSDRAQLSQTDSSGPVARGRPSGGFVSSTYDDGSMEDSLEEVTLCIWSNDLGSVSIPCHLLSNSSKFVFVEGAGTAATIRETVHGVTWWRTWRHSHKMKTGTQSLLPRAGNTTW